jgi:hypothetical protein
MYLVELAHLRQEYENAALVANRKTKVVDKSTDTDKGWGGEPKAIIEHRLGSSTGNSKFLLVLKSTCGGNHGKSACCQ